MKKILVVLSLASAVAFAALTPIGGGGGGGGAPTGPAGGDLGGTYPNPVLGVDRVEVTGDTMSGNLFVPSLNGIPSSTIAFLDSVSANVQTQINTNNAGISGLQGTTAGTSAAITALQGTTAATAANIAALQGATTTLQAGLSGLQGTTAATAAAIAGLQGLTAGTAADIAALQGATSFLSTGLSAIQGTTAATATAIAGLQAVTGGFVLKTGDSMSGSLSIGANTFINGGGLFITQSGVSVTSGVNGIGIQGVSVGSPALVIGSGDFQTNDGQMRINATDIVESNGGFVSGNSIGMAATIPVGSSISNTSYFANLYNGGINLYGNIDNGPVGLGSYNQGLVASLNVLAGATATTLGGVLMGTQVLSGSGAYILDGADISYAGFLSLGGTLNVVKYANNRTFANYCDNIIDCMGLNQEETDLRNWINGRTVVGGSTGVPNTSPGTQALELHYTGVTANTLPIFNANKAIVSSAVTSTEAGYLSGVTTSLAPMDSQILALQAATASNLQGITTLQGATSFLQTAISALQGTTSATAANIAALQGATSGYVAKAGSTMSGQLMIGVTSAQNFVLNRFGSNGALQVFRRDDIEIGSVVGTTTEVRYTAENDATLQLMTGSVARLSVTSSGAVTVGNPGNWPFVQKAADTMTGTLSIIATSPVMVLDAVTSQVGDYRFRTGGLLRWIIRKNATAEGGSSAGSDLEILARDDAGNAIDVPLTITRASGGSITSTRPLALTANLASSSNTTGSLVVTGGAGFTGNINASGGTIKGGTMEAVTGNVLIDTVGKGLVIKTGAGSRAERTALGGVSVLVTNGTVTANTLPIITGEGAAAWLIGVSSGTGYSVGTVTATACNALLVETQ